MDFQPRRWIMSKRIHKATSAAMPIEIEDMIVNAKGGVHEDDISAMLTVGTQER